MVLHLPKPPVASVPSLARAADGGTRVAPLRPSTSGPQAVELGHGLFDAERRGVEHGHAVGVALAP